MSKKITTIAMLAALSVSTLGAGVPTFADTTEYYYPPELVPIHVEYAEAMAECGTFIKKDNAYKNCYNRITNTFRERYGGLFESMYQLDYNGRMIITGLNPTAGTIRFYLDETRAFKNYPFTFENLVIFWADNTATVSPAWNEPAGWAFVDNYLATGEIPQGYHVLYNGKRGDAGWAPNTEMRATFGEDTTAKALIHNLPHKFIHVYGYDTEGNRHLENNYLNTCINDDLAKGGECRLQYIYNGANANPVYINAESADEEKSEEGEEENNEDEKNLTAIYEIEKVNEETGKVVKKRSYATIPLNVVMERLKQRLSPAPADENGNEPKFVLSPNDLVYVPVDVEVDLKFERKLDCTRIYKFVSCTGNEAHFIPAFIASPIIETKELGSNNKAQRAWTDEMIKEVCVPIKLDRLGNITKIGY